MRKLCTRSLTVIPVAGDHWAFVRGEHLAEVAAKLDAALERVGAAQSVNF
jgi:thioesterase domain-containing protein